MQRMKRLTEDMMLEPVAADDGPDASDAVLMKGGASADALDRVARQPELASKVMLVLPAPKASTIHKSFDEMEGILREFLSAVMAVTRDVADAAVSAEADEAEIRVSWTVNPEDVGRFISLAKSVPAWSAMRDLGASFQADK
jgi:hypothetical protein